ncbi:hypothetical protein HU200_023511 [Digitaria exilis]|uniref:RING-type E3 ubiquitin transferase n=1 Tax=Digitaria exilis TaxID=1010633 RepID=A0A835C056_9POAL|nr:hypothetical protein HU200_023511 [Digitaria exilis]
MDTGGHRRLSDRASSALAAVSVFLVLLFLFWRFIWQALKHRDGSGPTTTTTATTSPPPPPSCPALALAGETACATAAKSPLPVLFLRVAAVAGSSTGAEKVDCAVCLAELADGEPAARLVPGCGHGFHAECIEAWFRVNSTCPLCRAAVADAGQRSAGEAPHYCSSV